MGLLTKETSICFPIGTTLPKQSSRFVQSHKLSVVEGQGIGEFPIPRAEPAPYTSENLGPWSYIVTQAYLHRSIETAEYGTQYATLSPIFGHYDKRGSLQVAANAGSEIYHIPSFLTIAPETMQTMFELLSMWYEAAQQQVPNHTFSITANTSSINRLDVPWDRNFKTHPLRSRVSQSGANLHLVGNVLDRKFIQRLPNVDPNNREHSVHLGYKFSHESGIETDPCTQQQQLDLMKFDIKAWQRWVRLGVTDPRVFISPETREFIRNIEVELPENISCMPYGLEIGTPYSNWYDFLKHGSEFACLMKGHESRLAATIPHDHQNDFLLPGYNFNTIIYRKNGYIVINLAPHDSSRVGACETSGTVAVRYDY